MTSGGFYSLYRTTTDGAGLIGGGTPGFTKVYDLGLNDAAEHKAAITVMQCGLCEAVIGGNRVFLLGEYNMVPIASRTSANDLVRILISYDDGATWSTLVKWHTVRAGVANYQFDHIHAIRYNPYNGWIYICFGDGGTDGPAIMAWNPAGTGTWANDTDFDTQALQNGFYVAHNPTNQTYRYVDLLFTENYAHGITDAGDSTIREFADQVGIWRLNHNLTNFTRRNDEAVQFTATHTQMSVSGPQYFKFMKAATPGVTVLMTEDIEYYPS